MCEKHRSILPLDVALLTQGTEIEREAGAMYESVASNFLNSELFLKNGPGKERAVRRHAQASRLSQGRYQVAPG